MKLDWIIWKTKATRLLAFAKKHKKLALGFLLVMAVVALVGSCSLPGPSEWFGGSKPDPTDGGGDGPVKSPDNEVVTWIDWITSLLRTWGWWTILLALVFKEIRRPVTHLWTVAFQLVTAPLDLAWAYYSAWRDKHVPKRNGDQKPADEPES